METRPKQLVFILLCLLAGGCAHNAVAPDTASIALPSFPEPTAPPAPSALNGPNQWTPPAAPPTSGVIELCGQMTPTDSPTLETPRMEDSPPWQSTPPDKQERQGPWTSARGTVQQAPAHVQAHFADPEPSNGKVDSHPTALDSKRVTLNFDDTEVRKAMEVLSRDGGINILVSPGVKGTIKAHLKDVPAQDALHAIMNFTGLLSKTEGGITYIYTPDEAKFGLGPDHWVSTRIYHLNYARSTDIEVMLHKLIGSDTDIKICASPAKSSGIQGKSGGGAGGGAGSGGGGNAGTPVSTGGESSGGGSSGGGAGGGGGKGGSTGGNLYAAGEMIIVEAPASILRTIDRIVADCDVPPLQCDIEAVMLSVEHDHNQEFGINFAIADTGGKILGIVGDGSRLASTAGLLPGAAINLTGILGTASASTSTGAAATGSSSSNNGIVGGGGFINPEGGLKLANTRNGVTSIIRAIKATGKVEILARPHLMVVNSDEASLLIGSKLAYSTISQTAVSSTQQVEFLDVGTQLRVRPFIMRDGNIRMEVHPERSSGSVVNNLPQTTTSEVTTNVIIPDGATLIIAGLVDDEKNRQQDGLPILGDLPLVGTFFRERFYTRTKKELVVLLTPRIWNPARFMCESSPMPQQGPSLVSPLPPMPAPEPLPMPSPIPGR